MQGGNVCCRSLTSWEFMEVTTGKDPQADTHSAWINTTQRNPQKLWGGSFSYFTTSLKGFRERQQNKAGIRIPGEKQCLRTMAASIVYSHSVNHTLRSTISDLSPTDLRTAKTFWRLNSSGRRFNDDRGQNARGNQSWVALLNINLPTHICLDSSIHING